MLRTHHCGELTIANQGENVILAGWAHHIRDIGKVVFIDLRDRYGTTQLNFDSGKNAGLFEEARQIGREYVIQVEGRVVERAAKNPKIPTGEIEIEVEKLIVLNAAELPPFTIEDETDGGDEIRMKYRYLDLRRAPVRENIIFRHKLAIETRKYLDAQGFLEIETPYLIKSTPEGARDFVVPSRLNPHQFYALPQSPQTFKQLLMVSGFDRYFQIVRCFRDEDLRADRQPEFTQIDCEMSFVTREDILNTFEGLAKKLYKELKGIELPALQRMPYKEAMEKYGSDKPDLRFGMPINNLNAIVKNKGFQVFDNAEVVLAVNAKGCSEYSRKQTDELTDWVKRPQIGATGLVYAKWQQDGSIKSSVDKFFDPESIKGWMEACEAEQGDMLLILAGPAAKTYNAMGELRLEMGSRLGLRSGDKVAALWVVDFPLLERDEEAGRFSAMHHPFTSPVAEDIELLKTDPAAVRANAYDMVINGVEVGGGSIRIHDRALQQLMFKTLGFTDEEAEIQFGFLMNAFRFGAPPHGGIAFGFDRLSAVMAGQYNIRDFIAFPKNNMGRDMMIDSPAGIKQEQMDELNICLKPLA